MQEYEIYLPTKHNDGSSIDPAEIERIKQVIAGAFGGYTHLKQGSEGFWRLGGVTFLDEVTIMRVIDDGAEPFDGSERFDMMAFKAQTERDLQQESILIVAREVRVM